jgi:hypothetical protein
MISAQDEAPRPATGPDFGDAVTFSWADPASGRFGLARLSLVGGERHNALALVFDGSGDVAPMTEDLSAEIVTPLEAWRVRGAGLFDLGFTAISAPARVAVELSGVEGYEQLCRVEGTIRDEPVSGLGQRGHEWGVPAWERLELARTVTAWMGEDIGFAASTVRPVKAKSHAEEKVAAVLFDPEPEAVGETRLSTVYDGEGRQRRAGLELWLSEEDEYPRRLAGEAVCGTTVDLGELRLDVAFFHWHMEGRHGAGRYDVMRRKAG